MKQGFFEIYDNKPLTDNVYRMRLCGDTSAIKGPGQFVDIALDGLYLRRPISVCDCEEGMLTIIYKVVGKGTLRMSKMEKGRLDLLSGLGNGYDLSKSGDRPLLLGGGVGVPPLYWLAKRLAADGKRVTAVLGFNTKSEVFYEKEFEKIGVSVHVMTADGSAGEKGFVTDFIKTQPKDAFTYFYTCGPEPMLKAVYNATAVSGQFSFEARMGCGFGACMGCSCKTLLGNKRICKDGPVMVKEELEGFWNE